MDRTLMKEVLQQVSHRNALYLKRLIYNYIIFSSDISPHMVVNHLVLKGITFFFVARHTLQLAKFRITVKDQYDVQYMLHATVSRVDVYTVQFNHYKQKSVQFCTGL